MVEQMINPDSDPSDDPSDLWKDLEEPLEVARYLSGVYRDPEVSSFERTQAAAGLSAFWLGLSINSINTVMEQIMIVPTDVPTDVPIPDGRKYD